MARLEKGLTQARLAALSGVSRTTLNQLENGAIDDLGVRKVQAILEKVELGLSVEAAKARPRDFLKIAATTASVSFRIPLTERDVLRVLLTGRVPKGKEAQVRTLIEEAGGSLVQGLLQQIGGVSSLGRVAANVDRVVKRLKIPSLRAARWTTID